MKLLHTLFCLICVLSLTILNAQAQRSEQVGKFVSYQKIDHGVLITAENAKIMLTAYSPSIIRVRALKTDFGRDFSYALIKQPEGSFSRITDDADRLTFLTDSLKIVVAKKDVRFQFFNRDGKLLNEDDAGFGISWQGTEVTCYKKLFADERFIGLGEKVGGPDRRGTAYTNWNTDHYAYGIDADPLYTSIPFYIGLHDRVVYGIFLDNSYRTTFDFGASSDNRLSSFSASDGEMNYYFFGNSTVASIIEAYTSLTGRMPMPPKWSLGYQQCRWSYYPDTEVLNVAKTFREHHIPADVIYLDIHYMDGYKIFTWSPERFPDPKKMIDSLKAMGFHVVTIVDPGIKVEQGYFAYDQGVANDYFVKYPDGNFYIGNVWPGRCHFPDFTKANVREWWGKSFSRLIVPGVEGFWNDMNEPATWGQHIPDPVQFDFDGGRTTIKEAHNVYGMEMARSTFEGTSSLMNGKRPFVLTRAGYAGVQRYSSVWTGDNVPSDEHMLLAVRLVNSMGISGLPFTGSDIGGFSGDATPELFSRWMSIGTYTPLFRNHKQFGMKRQEPWSFGEDVEGRVRQSIEQRYRLMPYIYSTFYQATQTGLPVSRSLAIDYTFDEHTFGDQYQNEYCFGDNILVAPVASKENYAAVYLPEGGWYRLSSEQFYNGNQSVVAAAPMDDLPVFVKAGGIIPMQSVTQNTSQTPSDTLQLHIFYGKQKNSFLYYEDDGTTYAFRTGNFYKRGITFDPQEKTIRIQRVEGSYPTNFSHLNIVLHGFDGVSSVSVDTKSLQLQVVNPQLKTKSIVIPNSHNDIVLKW